MPGYLLTRRLAAQHVVMADKGFEQHASCVLFALVDVVGLFLFKKQIVHSLSSCPCAAAYLHCLHHGGVVLKQAGPL